jgi:hypothetical protein
MRPGGWRRINEPITFVSRTGPDETLLLADETVLVIWRTHPETIPRHNGPSLNQGYFCQDQ